MIRKRDRGDSKRGQKMKTRESLRVSRRQANQQNKGEVEKVRVEG